MSPAQVTGLSGPRPKTERGAWGHIAGDDSEVLAAPTQDWPAAMNGTHRKIPIQPGTPHPVQGGSRPAHRKPHHTDRAGHSAQAMQRLALVTKNINETWNSSVMPARADVAAVRSCLRCHSPFPSAGFGERICVRCKGSKAWRTGVRTPVSSGRRVGSRSA